MNGLCFPQRRQAKILSPEMLEPLFAKGLSRAQVAEELKIDYKNLSKRIVKSLSLTDAEHRGRLAFAAKCLEVSK